MLDVETLHAWARAGARCGTSGRPLVGRLGTGRSGCAPEPELPERLPHPQERAEDGAGVRVLVRPTLPTRDLVVEGMEDGIGEVPGRGLRPLAPDREEQRLETAEQVAGQRRRRGGSRRDVAGRFRYALLEGRRPWQSSRS